MYESWLADHVSAQKRGYQHGTSFARAIDELERGRKQTDWVWYVFPQWVGLGRSPEVQRFGVPSVEAAMEYLGHVTLRANYLTAVSITHSHLASGKHLTQIVGSLDSRKFVSSLTLMELVVGQKESSDDLQVQVNGALLVAQEQGFDRCEPTLNWAKTHKPRGA